MWDSLNWWVILFALVVFILVLFAIKIIFYSRKTLMVFLIYGFILLLLTLFYFTNIPNIDRIIREVALYGFIISCVITAPDIKESLELFLSNTNKKKQLIMGSEKTKKEIIEAVEIMSKTKTGALITIEKANSLEVYAERAINLDSEVNKELLINIFIPNTPLHDGAVIIRGDRIVCAGAYFSLSSNENFSQSSTGSRHRAALGVSELTDSLTVVVSEETGTISIAVEGIMIKINDREKLNEYLTTFMK